MLALTVTCRPAWKPWLLHQLAKQEHRYRLVVFDDCTFPQEWPEGSLVYRSEKRLRMTLGEKRQMLMQAPFDLGEPFAWFDDDDWHPKERLAMGEKLTALADVVGYSEGLFVDVKTLQTRRLDTGTRVTFNGAVFAAHCSKARFQPVNRGEDTLWLQTVLKDAMVVSSPMMQHCWMSHEGNITGKRGSMSFEGARFSRFDSWEKSFLEKLK